MTIIHREEFQKGGDGYFPRRYLLSAFSVECSVRGSSDYGRSYRVEDFDLSAGRVAETRQFSNPTVAEGFCAGWLPGGADIPNLLEAERRAVMQMRESRRGGAA